MLSNIASYNPLLLKIKADGVYRGATALFKGPYDFALAACEAVYDSARAGTFEPLIFFEKTNQLRSISKNYYCRRFETLTKDLRNCSTNALQVDWNTTTEAIFFLRVVIKTLLNVVCVNGLSSNSLMRAIDIAAEHYVAYDLQIHLVEERIRQERIKGQTTNVAQF